MARKNIAILAEWGERLLKENIESNLKTIETAVFRLKNPDITSEVISNLKTKAEVSLANYKSTRAKLDTCGLDITTYDLRFNELNEEYKKLK